MDFEYSNGSFQPYKSFDSIFADRKLPEFGNVESPFVREISTWRFFLANGEGEIPFGFEAQSFDDEDWDIMNVPSTWQMEGYGLPYNLLYNHPEELQKISKRGEESISDKFMLTSNNAFSDEIGIYRSSVVFTPEDIDRAIYLEASGISGRFMVYLNGQLQCDSHAVNTPKRILLSESAHVGVNQLVILCYRWDRDSHGKIIKEHMNYGFSGIYRPLQIVTESLVEISNLHITVHNVPDAFVNEFTNEKALEQKLVSKVSRGCYQLKADFKIRNHTDYMMPYAVRVSVMEARSEYDPYKFPFAKIDIKATPGGVVDAHKTITDSFELTAVDVAQWSDATPVQYDLILEVLDSEERIVCVKKRRFGFRSTEIVKGKFSINDKTLPLLLVKYYEFDPKGGITVSIDRFRQDVILMKRCGINGIITQGFPISETMLNLCDQYGLYVVALCDRSFMRDYMEFAMNHPSVIMWGFNDYGYNQADCLRTKSELKVLDSTRPWYCAADTSMTVSDIYPMPCEAGVVFGPWEDLCIDRKYVFDNNKLGKNLFETIPGRTHFNDDDADYKWIHHADLVGGKQKVNSSIGQGIVDSERNPHPVYHDIRKQCQSINIFSSTEDPTTLTMRNNHPFAYTPEVTLEWKVLLGGTSIMSGRGLITEIEPDGVRTLRFPIDIQSFAEDGWAKGNQGLIDLYFNSLSHELVFDISLKLVSNTYYASEKFEIAFYQDVLLDEVGRPTVVFVENDGNLLESGESDSDIKESMVLMTSSSNSVSESPVTSVVDEYGIVAQPDSLNVGNNDFGFTFSRKDGALNGIRVGEKEFVLGNLIPSFYRCPSNIDRTDRNFVLAKTIFSQESDYEEIQNSLEYVGSNYSVKGDTFSYIARYKSFAMKGEVIVAYEVSKADTLEVTLNFTPKYDMIRYGFRVPLSKEGVLCTWYGRGPGESYYDRKNATRIGVFSAGVDKIYHPYARPAENSSHTDTAAVSFSFEEGETFEVRRKGNARFDFTVLPFTPEQMNEYLHEELLMQNNFCELFLDFCSKEIERTVDNTSSLPLKKNVTYRETFEFKLSKK